MTTDAVRGATDAKSYLEVAAQSAAERPFVSVIIPVYDDNERLQLCLNALDFQTYPADRFEVLVVDNGSSPPVAGNVTGAANVVFLIEPRPGGFVARNTAIQAARGEVLAFTDADCYPEPRWIEAGVDAIGSSRCIVAGHVEAYARTPSPSAAERFEMLYGFEQEKNAARGESVSANIISPRRAFDDAGLFKTDSHSGHDYEWCKAAVSKGYEMVYVREAAVRTPARASVRALITKIRRMSGANYIKGRQRGTMWKSRQWAFHCIRPPVRRMYRALTEPGIGDWRHRAALCGILLVLPVAYAIEWMRMEAGVTRAERR